MAESMRGRKKQRTRRALEEAAFRLFEEKGYKETSVNEIAEAADVSPRTFFRYFGAKDELLFSHHSQQLDELIGLVRQAWDRRPSLASLEPAIIAFAERMEERKDTVLPRSRLVAETPSLLSRSLHLRHAWEEHLAAELASLSGRPEPDLGLRLLACMTVTTLQVAGQEWRESGGAESQADLARRTLDLLRTVTNAMDDAPEAVIE